MKISLLKQFSEEELGQSIWLRTQRTTSINELTDDEMASLYYCFHPMQNPVTLMERMFRKERIKELRAVILKDAQYLGLYEPENWEGFNHFMETRSVGRKLLYEYRAKEFPELIRQFKMMRKRYDERAERMGTREWYRKNHLPMPSAN